LDLKLSRLILAVRSSLRGEEAANKLRAPHPKANIEVWQLDMSDYNSVQAFASRVDSQLPRLDIVLLNAGIIKLHFTIVKSTGHEETMQVNYLSTMLLTVLLIPILSKLYLSYRLSMPEEFPLPDMTCLHYLTELTYPVKTEAKCTGTEPGRLTIVSAALTLAAKFPNREENPLLPSFDDPKTYDSQEHYHSSKLLAQMFLWKLVDYVSADEVIINLADPAWCKGTGLTRDVTGVAKYGVKAFASLTGRTKKVGASCFVDAVVNKGKESHGCFLMSWHIHPYVLLVLVGLSMSLHIWCSDFLLFCIPLR
jgi:NAD(P)-dependent dehydrogenase (short-subunit alcohol dehydrogenase family)